MGLKFNPLTANLDLVTPQNDVYVGSGGYAANLYFTTIDSDVTGYKKFMYTAESSETELTIPATTTEILARTYLFDSGLATTVIDAGKWAASFRAKVSGTQGAYLRFEAFLYHTDTTETTLFTATSDKITNTTYQTLSKESTQAIFDCDATDRLGCRIYAYTTHPAGITINTIVGDGNASYFSTPLSLRHSQLRYKNEEADVQHLTAAEKAKAIADYLKLDQTTPQTITGDIPLLDAGRTIDSDNQLVDKKYVDDNDIAKITTLDKTANYANYAILDSGWKYTFNRTNNIITSITKEIV